MRCDRIGDKKVKEARIPRRLRKKMAQRSSTESLAKQEESPSKLSPKSSPPSDALAVASSREEAGVIESTTTATAADSLESEEETLSGSLWYTHSKAVGPKIDPLGFDKDSDPPSAEELAAMEKALKYLKYGYTIKLTEFLPQADVDSGRNVPYKRANRLKTKLISMGADPSAIFFESRVIPTGETGKRRVALDLVVEWKN